VNKAALHTPAEVLAASLYIYLVPPGSDVKPCFFSLALPALSPTTPVADIPASFLRHWCCKMFLKAEPKGRESRLKESEKRRLRERILKRYPTVSEEQLNLVLPLSKQSELSVVKLTKREEIYR
ncbi:unnamed protein product, partial [Chrysoparadoxa australica]